MTSTSRREFLLGVAVGTVGLGTGWRGARNARAAPQAAMDAARRQAVERRRRVIFNNDGDDIWTKGADTVAKFLAVRHQPLLGTQVDSIYYCTTQSFNLFTHETSVAERFLSREGAFADNNLATFLDQQTDGLRMSTAFARQHGLEAIWTLRMNDIHDAWTSQFVSKWKKDDPRRVMSTLDQAHSHQDRRRLWSLVDFEHPDVEPRLVAIIAEVLRNYPVDGVELDFLRAPFYFRSHYEGGDVSDQQVQVLSQLVDRIRQLVLRESERQGRPLLLAARVPVTVRLCRRIGIDIAAWLQAGLIDVLAIGGGYVVFDQPVAGLIELGHQHGVPVYPCLSGSGLLYRPPRGNGEPQPPASWFAAAQHCFQAEADGVYCFNLFPANRSSATDYARAILSRMGAPESLQEVGKLYAISDAGNYMPAHYWAKDAEEFSAALPVTLPVGEVKVLPPLVVAQRFEPNREDIRAELRLDLSGLAAESVPRVLLNKAALGEPHVEPIAQVRRFKYSVPLSMIESGENQIALSVSENGATAVGAELWLRHKQDEEG